MQKAKENLVLLLDINTNYYLLSSRPNETIERISIEELITSILLFINCFLCCSSDNSFILYTYDSHKMLLLQVINL